MANSNRLIAACVSGALGLGAQQAGAAGFMLFEQSVSGLGNAFAGASSSAEDATTVYFNPAGMSRLGDSQFVGGLHFISPSTEFDDKGSTVSTSLPGGGGPLLGGDGDDGGDEAVVPNLYYTRALNDRWTAGLGISVPFGLATDWKDGWQGRYHALRSELKTVNINPSLAWQVAPRWSVGVGVSALYADLTEFSNAIDSFGVCSSVAGPGAAPCVSLGGPANAAVDSRVKLEGDDWGYGFNFGVLFQPDSRTRIGLAYRSKVELELDGSADYRLPGATAAAGFRGLVNAIPTMLSDTGASADLTLPEFATISSHQVLNDQWALIGEITWTRWSQFDELVIEFDNGGQDLLIDEDWDDTWRIALGMTYTASPRWKWRLGIAYDEQAAKRNDLVSPRIPDEDRTWVTTGVSYTPSEAIAVDVAYAHLFIPERKVRNADPSTGHLLVGEFDSEVDILSAQMRWAF